MAGCANCNFTLPGAGVTCGGRIAGNPFRQSRVPVESSGVSRTVVCRASGTVTAVVSGLTGQVCANGSFSLQAEITTAAAVAGTGPQVLSMTLTGNNTFVGRYEFEWAFPQGANVTQDYFLRFNQSSAQPAQLNVAGACTGSAGNLTLTHSATGFTCQSIPDQL